MNMSKVAIEVKEITVEELRGVFRLGSAFLYAILDACDESRIPRKVHELGPERAVSLYRGWAERDMWEIAPYLVQVDTQLFQWIIDNLWERPWGLFILARTDLASLRTHFRRFLMVSDLKGDQMYFRYYDPRVLEIYLKSCNVEELNCFFGEATRLYVGAGKNLARSFARH
jgi:hypothetical protein